MVDKKKLYENLGSLKFQKFVFFIEKLKFKIIDKVCPDIYESYNKLCDKRVAKLCSKCLSEEEKNKIILESNFKKMSFKRELVEKKNINYHFNNNNASSFYKYLIWNKNIHKRSMIFNIIGLILSIIGMLSLNGFLFGTSIIVFMYSLITFVIDFECINLQNYNIYRFEEKKQILEKIEKRAKEKDLEKYKEVSKGVYQELTTSIEIPKSETIVSKLTTLEQIEQLRKLALEIKNQRIISEPENVKVKKRSVLR